MRAAGGSIRLPSGGALLAEGPPDGTPLLFLHGLGGGAWSWRPQRAAFSPACRVFVWEARGRGTTARVDDAGLSEWYTDAKEALGAVLDETRRPAFVVGHSVGGLLAMALDSDVAAAVQGLFAINPAYVGGRPASLRVRSRIGSAGRLMLQPAMRFRRVARWLFERSFEDRAAMETAWEDQRAQAPLEYPRILQESLGGPQGFGLRDFAKEIADPTFIIEGSRSHRSPRFPKLVRTLRERLGDEFTYESVPGGYYLQLDRPDVVNDRLRRFIETVH